MSDDFNSAEDFADDDLPRPIETGTDYSSPAAHAAEQRKIAEAEAKAKKSGKSGSIMDTLKKAEATVSDRNRDKIAKTALGKDLKDLRPGERKQLQSWLKDQPENLSDEEKDARKGMLRELKKLEPKRDKPESISEGWKGREAALERAFKAHAHDLNPADLRTDEQKQVRADLKARWPMMKLGEVLGFFEKWHDALRADPNNWQRLAQEYAEKTAPQNDAMAKTAKSGKTIADALKRASADAEDIADLSDFIKKFGANTPHLLERANQWDKALREDPYGAASRLAAHLGGLRTPQPGAQQGQQPQVIQPRTHEEHYSNVMRGIDLFERDHAPDFKEHATEIAKILNSGIIPVHLNNFDKLKLAYETAKQQRPKRKQQKSIKGAPGNYKDSGRAASKSVRGSLERAMGAA